MYVDPYACFCQPEVAYSKSNKLPLAEDRKMRVVLLDVELNGNDNHLLTNFWLGELIF